MLVTSEPNSGPPSRCPSILDSPTLARVERARLRLEAATATTNGTSAVADTLERKILDPKHSLLAGRIPIESITGPIKRGLLWQQRDRLFSRWKERYFVLTRDYLHCFKRASGSANERISDMGQFIFKVKLVDVEKVEWLNRRSYSAISLFLGREGRVLLRAQHGLEDWFELLEECTLSSKERRHALRITQGPRSRASLAAPPCHSSLQSNHMGLGGTYSSALEDWLLTRHKPTANSVNNHFQLCDSVPDLSGFNENSNSMSISTNHSAPRKIPNHTRYLPNGNGYPLMHNHSYSNVQQSSYSSNRSGFYSNIGSPLRYPNLNNRNINKHITANDNDNNNNSNSNNRNDNDNNNNNNNDDNDDNNNNNTNNIVNDNNNNNNEIYDNDVKNADHVDYENDDDEVQLRRNVMNRTNLRYDNEPERDEWLYRRPNAPNDIRHSLLTDIDISGCDSGLDTPPSTHRPSSYRDVYYMSPGARDSTDTGVSSSRGTLVSPGSSFRVNGHVNGNINGLRYSVQEKILRNRNEEDRFSVRSAIVNKLNANEAYDSNQNKYYKMNGLQHSPILNGNGNHHHYANHITNGNGNGNGVSSAVRERYQHPALLALINEAQGMKFRDRSFSDIQQQLPRRQPQYHHNHSPSPRRRPLVATPTRV